MALSRRDLLCSAAATAALLGTSAASWAAGSGWQLPAKRKVKVIESEWIPMADGVRLSVRLWLPEGAETHKVPVVLEYIPYRKRDLYRLLHDNAWGEAMASHGIAYARLDARGSGDSEGVLVDEYLARELDDGVQAIAWLAKQPWSNGNVGMRGISWGGFNTLQVAALAPPELKAIMPMCATDTRYTDDAHYIGGAVGLTNFQWGVQFKGVMASPPDPAISGPNWPALWQQRLEATPGILETWLNHQRNDAYWQHASVSTDYAAIKCPVYIVDGWVDTYVNSVTRLLGHLTVPRKALFGAWAHNYPEGGTPGPSLDWIWEEVRWWDQWLNGTDTGIMREPMLRVYMPERTASEGFPAETPGRWIAETSWPVPSIGEKRLYLDQGKLALAPGAESAIRYVGDKVVGLGKPEWLPFPPEGLPGEQSADDRKSLVFDGDPLEADLEILGHPMARIRVAADVPVAKLALRLCEVLPDGRSWLVTYGLLNLTHRDSHEHPTPLEPGKPYDVTVELSLIAHRFKKGSRIRLAVSESLWPLVWPSPRIATLTLTLGTSSLALPVRPHEQKAVAFPIPVKPKGAGAAPRRAGLAIAEPDAEGRYRIEQKAPEHEITVPDTGTVLTGKLGLDEVLEIKEGDPNSSVWRVERTGGFRRGDWDCSVFSACEIRSTETAFLLKETLRASRDGKVIFERAKESSIPRDLM